MRSFISTPSPVESLTSSDSAGVWGALKYPKLIEELAIRRKLRSQLDQITGPIDWSTDFSDELYQSLCELLANDANHRFILYCPFDLIPTADSYRRYHTSLDDFAELYLHSWRKLLTVHDVRANFVDGDVPDIELDERPMDRVVQAAYIAPILLQKGLLSNLQLYALYNQDEVLINSFKDALSQRQTDALRNTHNVSDKRAKWLRWDRRRQIIKKFERSLYERYKNKLAELFQNPELRDDVISVLCRLYHANVIPKEQLDELGVFVPSLSGPFYQNLAPISKDLLAWQELLVHPELIDIIYPVHIVYGSRLKGYGGIGSDVDRAVFVKPGVTDRNLVDRLLFKHLGHVAKYWLVEDEFGLHVNDFPKAEALVGNSTDAHVLFGGAWEGDRDTISILSDKLLRPYAVADTSVRKVLAEEMERDLLQYRLLHRGYEKYYITSGPTFMDAGYRMMASRIYASHVYVP